MRSRETLALVVAVCGVLPIGAVVACGSGDSSTGAASNADSGSQATGDEAADAGSVDAAPDVPPPRPPAATIAPPAIDFGNNDCGGAAPANKTITLSNGGDQPLNWSASLDSIAVFSIQGASSGTVPGGGSATITLAAKAVPASASAASVSQASLVVTTNDPARAMTFVPVAMTAQGATLQVTPAVVAFGQLPVSTTAPAIPLVVKNVGNAPATVALKAPPNADFTVTWTGAPAGSIVAPGATLAGASADFTPSTITPSASGSAVDVTGAVCGGAPDPIALNGQGTNGVVGVSPGALDFGLVNCGTQGVAQQLSVLDAGNAGFAFTASLGKGSNSPYSVSMASGTVLAGQQVTLTVTPKPIPAVSAITTNLYGDTLTVTTNAAGDTPHAVTLTQTAQGAILVAAAGPLAFGSAQVGTAPTLPLALTNNGNVAANVTLTTAAPFGAPAAPVNVASGGGTANPSLSFTPDPNALVSSKATVTLSTSDPLCAPLPAPVGATGTAYDRISAIGVGGDHSCADATSGYTYCWGTNFSGELGDGTNKSHDVPKAVSNLSGATLATGGYYTSCAAKSATPWCWGDGMFGALGDGNTSSSLVPVQVSNVTDATAISGGAYSVCALRKTGIVACWGYDFYGQLGNGTTTDSSVPVTVSAPLTSATALSTGYYHACAIQSSTVYCWGANWNGQLGNGTNADSHVPKATSALPSAPVAIASGYAHSCAALQNGSVSCWGANWAGQLGNGTNVDSWAPVQVKGLPGSATAVVAGSYFSCALLSGGGVACWGEGTFGELGNGSDTSSNVAVSVSSLSTATALSAGNEHACALQSGGTLVCWGSNWSGQLGNESVPGGSSVPVAVAGLH